MNILLRALAVAAALILSAFTQRAQADGIELSFDLNLMAPPGQEQVNNLSASAKAGLQPVEPNDVIAGWPVTSGWGYRTHPVHGTLNTFHYGVDLAHPDGPTFTKGTPIYVVANPGDRVSVTCWVQPNGGGIIVEQTRSSAPGETYQSFHLESCFKVNGTMEFVYTGKRVVIGRVGNTGTSTNYHLHFGWKVNGGYQKPLRYQVEAALTGKSPDELLNGARQQLEAIAPPPVVDNSLVAAVPQSVIYQPGEIIPSDGIEISFDLEEPPAWVNKPAPAPRVVLAASGAVNVDALFEGGNDSLVARAVGSAEGTRTPDGGKTWAYTSHIDPGNGVTNQGTFSYQHGANSPEEADQKQLARLRRQTEQLQAQAKALGIELTLDELINGIDLANQSPRAALQQPGSYSDRLKEASENGFTGWNRILHARARSYIDPDTGRLSAPGLGNTWDGVYADQERRMRMIAAAIEQSNKARNIDQILKTDVPQEDSSAAPPPEPREPTSNVERILSIDLSHGQ